MTIDLLRRSSHGSQYANIAFFDKTEMVGLPYARPNDWLGVDKLFLQDSTPSDGDDGQKERTQGEVLFKLSHLAS